MGREKKAFFLGSLGGGSLFQGIIAKQVCAAPWGNFRSLWVPYDWADRQATWKPQCIVGKESSLLASLSITTQWHLKCLIGISLFYWKNTFRRRNHIWQQKVVGILRAVSRLYGCTVHEKHKKNFVGWSVGRNMGKELKIHSAQTYNSILHVWKKCRKSRFLEQNSCI